MFCDSLVYKTRQCTRSDNVLLLRRKLNSVLAWKTVCSLIMNVLINIVFIIYSCSLIFHTLQWHQYFSFYLSVKCIHYCLRFYMYFVNLGWVKTPKEIPSTTIPTTQYNKHKHDSFNATMQKYPSTKIIIIMNSTIKLITQINGYISILWHNTSEISM